MPGCAIMAPTLHGSNRLVSEDTGVWQETTAAMKTETILALIMAAMVKITVSMTQIVYEQSTNITKVLISAPVASVMANIAEGSAARALKIN